MTALGLLTNQVVDHIPSSPKELRRNIQRGDLIPGDVWRFVDVERRHADMSENRPDDN